MNFSKFMAEKRNSCIVEGRKKYFGHNFILNTS